MAHSLHIDKLIILANRQRQDFDPEALTDLANSIASKGLMHPIVCRETSSGVTLVAGERRLRALEQLWLMGDAIRHNGLEFAPYHLPYVTLGELDPLEAEEAELDENIKRRDLTWQERSEALSRLHALRKKQAELAGGTHGIADTLEEANVPKGSYSAERQTLLLASHLHKPEVAAAKTPAEAFKIVKREEERERSRALAEQVGASYSSAAHKLHHVDCLSWLVSCDDGQYDVILTDPPYGMNAQAFGDAGGKLAGTDHQYDDSVESWRELMTKFLPEAYRVAKRQAHAYIFCDFDRFHELKAIAEKAGWYVFRTPLIVYKLGSGRVPLPEHGPRRQYELCLYAIKGNRPVTGIYSDVIPCKLEENFAHGANKPVELYIDLLRRSVRPGDSVLDAFAGTGTIFPAAHACKLYATGLEISSEYYGIAVKRLNALDTEPAMI
jgi:site-specific DNA-methyltransferase (adenine-specific)